MKKFSLRFTAVILLPVAFISCRQTEHTEEITAEITAAQMEGRKAAASILTPQWQDSIQLMKVLLEVKSKQSKYLIENKPKSAKAFDDGFISTVKAVNPDLAKKIIPEEPEQK